MKKIYKKIIGLFIAISVFFLCSTAFALPSSITPSVGTQLDYRNGIDFDKNLDSFGLVRNYLYTSSTPLFSTKLIASFPTGYNSSCKLLQAGEKGSLASSEWSEPLRKMIGAIVALVNADMEKHPADKKWYYYMGQYAIDSILYNTWSFKHVTDRTYREEYDSEHVDSFATTHELYNYIHKTNPIKNSRASFYIDSLIRAAYAIYYKSIVPGENKYDDDDMIVDNNFIMYGDKVQEIFVIPGTKTAQNGIIVSNFLKNNDDDFTSFDRTLDGSLKLNGKTAGNGLCDEYSRLMAANCWDEENGQHVCSHYVTLQTNAPDGVEFYYKAATKDYYNKITPGTKIGVPAKAIPRTNYYGDTYVVAGERCAIQDYSLGDLKIVVGDNVRDDFDVTLNFTENRKYPVAYNYDCGATKPSFTSPEITYGYNTLTDKKEYKIKVSELPRDYTFFEVYIKKSPANTDENEQAEIEVQHGDSKMIFSKNSDECSSDKDDFALRCSIHLTQTGEYCFRQVRASNGYSFTKDNNTARCFKVEYDKTNSKVVWTTDDDLVFEEFGINGVFYKTFDYTFNNNLNKIKFGIVDINDNNKNIGPAKLQIEDKNGNVVTHNNQKMIFDYNPSVSSWIETRGLPFGEYYLTEVTPPKGYIKNADRVKFVINGKKSSESDKTVYLKDTPISLTVSKYDKTYKNRLAGAKLQILNAGTDKVAKTIDDIKMSWTSTTEPQTYTGVPAGSYILREIEAPEGYDLADDISFTINDNGEVLLDGVKKTEVSIVNVPLKPVLNTILFNKIDKETKKPVVGAKLQILDNNKEVVILDDKKLEWTVSEDNNPYAVEGLKEGTYYLHEVSVPDGYKESADIKFTVDSDGKVTYNGLTDGSLTSESEIIKSKVSFKKVNEKGKAVTGVKLQVLDSNKKVVTLNSKKLEWTTSSDSYEVEGLGIGTYYLHEVSVPDGYEKSNDIEFIVNSEGKVLYNGNVVSEIKSVVKTEEVEPPIEEPVTANVSFKKVNEKGKAVTGVKLQVLDSNKKVVTLNSKKLEWTTSSDSYEVEGLGIGTYYLHEVSVPDGYEKSNDIEFIVNSEGKVLYNGNVVSEIKAVVKTEEVEPPIEEPVTANVSFKKVNEKGKAVTGVKLQVLDSNKKVVTLNSKKLEWTTSSDSYEVEGLGIGTYYLHEVSVPDGYEKSNDVSFVVNSEGKVLYNGNVVSEIKAVVKTEEVEPPIEDETVISTNVTTKIYISKINEKTKEIVVGAHFELRNEKDVLIEEWDSTTEAHYIEKLSVGHTYRVIQTKAGIDDSISDPIVFTVDKDGNITGDTVFLSKSVSVPNTLLRRSLFALVIGASLVVSGLFIVIKRI